MTDVIPTRTGLMGLRSVASRWDLRRTPSPRERRGTSKDRAVGVVLAVVTIVAVAWWEQRAIDQACERLDRHVVTNQEEADELFDEKAAAGCLGRN